VQDNVSPFEVGERERAEQQGKFWGGKPGESFEAAQAVEVGVVTTDGSFNIAQFAGCLDHTLSAVTRERGRYLSDNKSVSERTRKIGPRRPSMSGPEAFRPPNLPYAVHGVASLERHRAANNFEHVQGRVFQAITRIISASPVLGDSRNIAASKIEFASRCRPVLEIFPNMRIRRDRSNPMITVFDEL
jgi:hypothetical protein